MSTNTKVSAVDEKLPLNQSLVLGLQHVFIAILSGIPVPLLVGASVGLSDDYVSYFINSVIFTTGICSILMSLGIIKIISPKVPVMMGISFSVISVCTTTLSNAVDFDTGFQLIAGATIIAGIFCFLIAPIWSKLDRFFPPIVIGTNLMILSIALVPNSFHWIMNNSTTGQVEPSSLYLALFVFILNVVLSKFLKGFLGNLTILFSLLAGTIVAIATKMVDFSGVSNADLFGFTLPFKYGLPKFDIATTISFVIVMILGMVEISGTVIGVHNIVGKEMNEKQLTKTLQTTGLNTVISGVFNSSQPISFIQNVGLLDLSKSYSRFTTAIAGVMLLILSFFPKFAALVAAIPKPVLGGIGFATFGIIVASGVNVLKGVSFEGNKNMLIIGLSVAVAMIPATYPDFYGNFPDIIQNIFGSGLLAGSLVAILLNIFFNFSDIIKPKEDNVEPVSDDA